VAIGSQSQALFNDGDRVRAVRGSMQIRTAGCTEPKDEVRMAQKILLVEDDEMNRDMLSRRLELKGFIVVLAFDGQQGLDLAIAESPDLILMDMSLPEVDGWEATRRLKAEQATRPIPVIALTAHAMVSDRARILAVGCDDYDTKPVDLKRLLLKIDNLLSREATP
jgi:two-component system, cell cycle response regulator DivK